MGEEAGEWYGNLRLSSPSPLPVHTLLPECGCNVTSRLLVPVTMSLLLLPCLLHHNLLNPSGTVIQTDPFSFEFL